MSEGLNIGPIDMYGMTKIYRMDLKIYCKLGWIFVYQQIEEKSSDMYFVNSLMQGDSPGWKVNDRICNQGSLLLDNIFNLEAIEL